jgi:hypothetical protein
MPCCSNPKPSFLDIILCVCVCVCVCVYSYIHRTLFDALLEQPQAFHDGQSAGELSSRLATGFLFLTSSW